MNNKIMFSNDIVGDLLNQFSNGFMYKKILFISETFNSSNNPFDSERNNYLIMFANYLGQCDIDEYDLIVFDNYMDLLAINKCKINDKPFIVITNRYLSYDYVEHLLSNSNLLRLIIDKQIESINSIVYCEYLIDAVYHYVNILDEKLKKLFYETNYQYMINTFSGKNIVNLKDFNLYEMYDNLKDVSGFMKYVLKETKHSNDFSFKLLFIQVQLNLYKNFIKSASPYNVDMLEKYSFDCDKFWFVLNQLRSNIISDIVDLEYLIIKVKSNLVSANVDYYYKLCKKYSTLDIKTTIAHCIETYKGGCLLKIIYQMGLIKFNV